MNFCSTNKNSPFLFKSPDRINHYSSTKIKSNLFTLDDIISEEKKNKNGLNHTAHSNLKNRNKNISPIKFKVEKEKLLNTSSFLQSNQSVKQDFNLLDKENYSENFSLEEIQKGNFQNHSKEEILKLQEKNIELKKENIEKEGIIIKLKKSEEVIERKYDDLFKKTQKTESELISMKFDSKKILDLEIDLQRKDQEIFELRSNFDKIQKNYFVKELESKNMLKSMTIEKSKNKENEEKILNLNLKLEENSDLIEKLKKENKRLKAKNKEIQIECNELQSIKITPLMTDNFELKNKTETENVNTNLKNLTQQNQIIISKRENELSNLQKEIKKYQLERMETFEKINEQITINSNLEIKCLELEEKLKVCKIKLRIEEKFKNDNEELKLQIDKLSKNEKNLSEIKITIETISGIGSKNLSILDKLFAKIESLEYKSKYLIESISKINEKTKFKCQKCKQNQELLNNEIMKSNNYLVEINEIKKLLIAYETENKDLHENYKKHCSNHKRSSSSANEDLLNQNIQLIKSEKIQLDHELNKLKEIYSKDLQKSKKDNDYLTFQLEQSNLKISDAQNDFNVSLQNHKSKLKNKSLIIERLEFELVEMKTNHKAEITNLKEIISGLESKILKILVDKENDDKIILELKSNLQSNNSMNQILENLNSDLDHMKSIQQRNEAALVQKDLLNENLKKEISNLQTYLNQARYNEEKMKTDLQSKINELDNYYLNINTDTCLLKKKNENLQIKYKKKCVLINNLKMSLNQIYIMVSNIKLENSQKLKEILDLKEKTDKSFLSIYIEFSKQFKQKNIFTKTYLNLKNCNQQLLNKINNLRYDKILCNIDEVKKVHKFTSEQFNHFIKVRETLLKEKFRELENSKTINLSLSSEYNILKSNYTKTLDLKEINERDLIKANSSISALMEEKKALSSQVNELKIKFENLQASFNELNKRNEDLTILIENEPLDKSHDKNTDFLAKFVLMALVNESQMEYIDSLEYDRNHLNTQYKCIENSKFEMENQFKEITEKLIIEKDIMNNMIDELRNQSFSRMESSKNIDKQCDEEYHDLKQKFQFISNENSSLKVQINELLSKNSGLYNDSQIKQKLNELDHIKSNYYQAIENLNESKSNRAQNYNSASKMVFTHRQERSNSRLSDDLILFSSEKENSNQFERRIEITNAPPLFSFK